jgi:hypothetical protein
MMNLHISRLDMNSVGTDIVYSLHRQPGPGGAEEDAEYRDGKIHRRHEGRQDYRE